MSAANLANLFNAYTVPSRAVRAAAAPFIGCEIVQKHSHVAERVRLLEAPSETV